MAIIQYIQYTCIAYKIETEFFKTFLKPFQTKIITVCLAKNLNVLEYYL